MLDELDILLSITIAVKKASLNNHIKLFTMTKQVCKIAKINTQVSTIECWGRKLIMELIPRKQSSNER